RTATVADDVPGLARSHWGCSAATRSSADASPSDSVTLGSARAAMRCPPRWATNHGTPCWHPVDSPAVLSPSSTTAKSVLAPTQSSLGLAPPLVESKQTRMISLRVGTAG